MQNENYFDSWLSIANPISGKILVLELLPKMFLANQIAGLFKVFYLPKKLRVQVYSFVDKHQSFLQYGTIVYPEYGQACPKVPKITSLQNLYDNSDDHQRFL